MYIALKPATHTDAGVMSAYDKTNLDNLASNLMVLTQNSSDSIPFITLSSIGGKTKDSEMRKIVDDIGSVTVCMPGIITLPYNTNTRGKLWCSCCIDKSIVGVSGTMKDMLIGISIDQTVLSTNYNSIVYQLFRTKVTDVNPCTLSIVGGPYTKKIAFT